MQIAQTPPLDYLREQGTASATVIRAHCGLTHEEVYAELVQAEARGLVRVEVSYFDRGARPRTYWAWMADDDDSRT
jgi:hypothetical protein